MTVSTDRRVFLERLNGSLADASEGSDGWEDGRRASTMSAVEAARRMLEPMAGHVPPPAVTPSPEGGVEVSWPRLDVEASVSPTGAITCYDLSDGGDGPGMGVCTFGRPGDAAAWLMVRAR